MSLTPVSGTLFLKKAIFSNFWLTPGLRQSIENNTKVRILKSKTEKQKLHNIWKKYTFKIK